MDSDETFSFEYVNPAKGEVDSDIIITSFTLNSVRGIIALLVMLASFIGVMNLYKDNDHKIFFAFKGIKRPVAMILEILNITILAGISGVASIYLCEIDEGLINEITRMLIYALLSSLYFYIIYKIIKNRYIFATLIPLFVIGSIIFTPVFFDFSKYLPLIFVVCLLLLVCSLFFYLLVFEHILI